MTRAPTTNVATEPHPVRLLGGREPRTARSSQSHYSALAITAAPILRGDFRVALRQTEGLVNRLRAWRNRHIGVDADFCGRLTWKLH
jgi:hypothetical protein